MTLPLQGDDEHQWHDHIDFVVQSVGYAAFLVVMLLIVALILKLLVSLVDADFDGGSSVEQASETNSLLPKEAIIFSYGACDEVDLECGQSNCGSSDDLYDGKICVICFDDQRSCFFIPCGHFVTCYTCAKRIAEGESRTCPICRRLISKVNRLFVS